MNRADERSEKHIASLHPKLQPLAREFILRAQEAGIDARIISGHRSYAEQDALYAKGRTAPGSKVTNAKAGFSNHNFGLAFDIGIFKGREYLPESPLYKAAAQIAKPLGLEWGGDWKSFPDEPHYELRPEWAKGLSSSALLAALRERVEQKKDVLS